MLAQIQDTGMSFPAFVIKAVIMALFLSATVMIAVRIIGRSSRRVAALFRAARVRAGHFLSAGPSRKRHELPNDPAHHQHSAHAHSSHAIAATALFLIICGGLTRASLPSSSSEPLSRPRSSTEKSAADYQPEARSSETPVSAAPVLIEPAGTVGTADTVIPTVLPTEGAGMVAEAAGIHSQGDVLLLQVSPELLSALLGEAGATSLAQLQARVGRKVSQAYALIPLTVPGNPVTSGGPSLLAANRLKRLPRLLGMLLRSTVDPQKPFSSNELPSHTATGPVELPEVGDASLPAPLIPVEDATPLPEWVRQPNGDRIVVEAIAPSDEDSSESLKAAVGEAFTQHLSEQLKDRIRPQAHWDRLVRLQLSPETLQECVVDQHQLVTDIPMPGGTQKWRKTYALVRFPEAVDRAAVHEIRQAVQQHRMAAVLLVTGLFWMALFSAGLLLRAGRDRTGLLRMSATAGTMLVSLPLGLFAAALTLAVCRGDAVDLPWEQGGKAVTIDARH